MNAVILGGSTGVGLSVAYQLAARCKNICISSRNPQNLESALVGLTRVNPNTLTFSGDVGNRVFAQSLSSFLKKSEFGFVDILVCNAGGPPQKGLVDTTSQDWDFAIETNLLGQIRLVKEFIPGMASRNFGRIIFLSSTVAKEPSPSMVLSATARAGISAFSKAISVEFASKNVTVNTILLGGVLTSRLESLVMDSAKAEGVSLDEMRTRFVSNIPTGRFAKPNEISRVVDFLASPDSGYITGQSISIDGGLTKGIF